MSVSISVTVNGWLHEAAVEPHTRLVDFLREDLGLTGTKEGCGTGDCGSCTVLLDERPVNSCLTLAAETDGANVTTVEGIAAGGYLTPVQAAFLETGATQCGFCTPGFIVMATALLKETPNPTEEEIRYGLAGNLCRCTGYDKIIKAVQMAAAGESPSIPLQPGSGAS